MTTKQFRQLCAETGRDANAELLRAGRPHNGPTESKFRNREKILDGIRFKSGTEARVYVTLKWWEKAGEITDLVLQPRFLLQEKFRDSEGVARRRIEYVADFQYRDRAGRLVVVEVKGCETPVWKMKEKLFRAKFPNLRLEVWKGKP